MTNTAQYRVSGIMILTTPDGKVINMRVRDAALEIDQDVDEYSEKSVNGSTVVQYSLTRTTVELDGVVEGMTVTDPKKASSD